MTITKLPNDFKENIKSFEHAENVIKSNSKTFYQAFSQLSDIKKYSIFAVYAFCRKADDLIDEYEDPKALEEFENELKLFANGQETEDHIWKALRVVFNNFDMEIEPFFEQIKGQKMDQNFRQPITQDKLEEYSYYVASTVGLMILPILSKQSQEIQNEGVSLGIAMQITNILRDLNEDYQNNRIYLPKEVLEKFNYNLENDFDKKIISDNFYKVFEFEKQRAIKLYDESENMIPFLDEDSRKAVLLSLEYYKAILYKIEENKYDIYGKKTKVGKLEKLKIINNVNNKLKEL